MLLVMFGLVCESYQLVLLPRNEVQLGNCFGDEHIKRFTMMFRISPPYLYEGASSRPRRIDLVVLLFAAFFLIEGVPVGVHKVVPVSNNRAKR